MVTFSQYPYSLFVITTAIITDPSGNKLKGSEVRTFASKCRDDRSYSARNRFSHDSDDLKKGVVVFMPLSAPEVALDAAVELTDANGKLRIKGRVISSERTQLNYSIRVDEL